MDGERVNSPSSEDNEEAGRAEEDHPTLTYTKVFNDVFPYYLSIGMSAREFWRGDVHLAKAYRQAERLREDRKNSELWLQGMYFYEALCDASPIFNPYAKAGTKPHPYSAQPYALHAPTKAETISKEKAQMDKIKKQMDAYATRINGKFKKNKEVSNDSA